MILLLVPPLPARAQTYWNASSDNWSVASDWTAGLPTSSTNAYIANGGTATVSSTGPACSYLYLGTPAGSGLLQMSGGSLVTQWDEDVGYSGTGSFTQSGGTNSPSSNLNVGYLRGSSGTYTLNAGTLSCTNFEYVGYYGTGNFVQTGGSSGFGASVYLGYNAGSSGTYSLNGGALGDMNEYVGYSGIGSFTQTGGTNAIAGGSTTSNLYLGCGSGSSGTYNLSGTGQLSALSEYVGYGSGATALFQQSGGSNTASNISIGSGGRYVLSGGTLSISYGGISNQGTIDLSNSQATLTVGSNCIVDLSQAVLTNVGSMNVSVGANSLLIVPPGFNPSTGFASYSCLGMTHTAGTTLVVPAGRYLAGSGSINDQVSCQGTITNASPYSPALDLNNGLVISGAGNVTLGWPGNGNYGNLVVNDPASGITGGSLTLANQYVGTAGTGVFTQSGGSNAVSNYLYLGYNPGNSGSYSLSGTGTLSAAAEYVGLSGVGAFAQSGGANSAGSTIFVGASAGSTGTYNLRGSGQLYAGNEEIVGSQGAGTFTQAGGTNTANLELLLASASTSYGAYNLNGGTLIVRSIIGGSGTAAFNFNGGILRAVASFSTTLPLTLGAPGGNATIDSAGYTVTLSGTVSGPGNLVKIGTGTLALGATNTYTGPTAVNAGILSLTGSLSPSSALMVGGGTLSYAPTANGGTGNSQTVAGLTVNAGLSAVNVTTGNTLALGAITRGVGGVVGFSSTGTITTSTGNANGILGPWAVYGSGATTAYATGNGTIAAYSPTIVSTIGALTDQTGTLNYSLSGAGGTLAAPLSANTLQLTGSTATAIAIGGNTVTLNGILNENTTAASSISGTAGLVIGGTKELVYAGPGSMSVASPVVNSAGGASALTMAGSGTLTLTGSSTYSGGTYVENGTLSAGASGALGRGNVTVSGGALTVGAANALDGGAAQALVVSGGTATLNYTDSYTGGTTLIAGAVAANAAGALGGGRVAVSGGTFTGSAANALTGGQALIVSGGTATLSQANSYTGGTTVSAGTLQANYAGALGAGNVAVSGGTLTESATNGLTGSQALLISSGAVTLSQANNYSGGTTVSGSGTLQAQARYGGALGTGNVTLSGGTLTETTSDALTGGQALVVSGGAAWLAYDNDYSGGTTVNGGTLSVTGSLNPSGTLAVGGGTFSFGGTAAQAVNGLAVNAGASVVSNTNSGATPVLALGGITRSVGGTVDFPTATGTADVITTTRVNTSGIIGGWATQGGGATWAVAGNGTAAAITGLSTYTTTTVAGNTPGSYTNRNIDVTSSPSPTAGITPNSLRFNTAAAETLTLTGTNIIASGGILVTSNVGNNPSTITGGALEGASGADLVVIQNNTSSGLTVASVIADNASPTALTKSGAGTAALTASNTYTGGTTINAGTLAANAAEALGTGNVTVSGGTLTTSAANALTGSQALLVSGGTAALGQANTYSGGTTLRSGTLDIDNSGALGAGALTITGGTIDSAAAGITVNNNPQDWDASFAFGGSNALNLGTGSVYLWSTTLTITTNGAGTLTIGGTISDSGNHYALTKAGPGTLTMAGTNTYNGGTTVSGGMLQAAKTRALPGYATAGKVSVGNGGTLAVNAGGTGEWAAADIDTLRSNASFASGSALGIDTTNAASGFTYASNIGGGLGITKLGANTLTLTGANSYIGTTTISGGTLALVTAASNNNIGGSGKILVGSGATLDATGVTASGGFQIPSGQILAGSGLVNGGTTVLSGGTVSPGDFGVVGILSTGAVTFSSGSTLAVDVGAGAGNADLLAIGETAMVNMGASISFNLLGTPDQGKYVLATATSGLGGSASALTSSTVPTGYHLISSGTELDLSHRPTLGTATATPAAPSIITGGSTAVTVSVQNTAPSGGDTLNFTAVPTANMTGTAGGTAAAGSASSPRGGLTFSGTAFGTCQGTFTVSDPNATNSPQTGTVTVTVMDHANASLSPTANQTTQTIDFGNVLKGATVPGRGFTIYNRAVNTTVANTANLKLTTGFTASGDAALSTNLATFGGLAAGNGNNYTASLNTANYTTTGSSTVTLSAAQLADDSSLPGAGGNNNGAISVTLKGNVGNATADNSNSQSSFGTALTAPVAQSAGYAGLDSRVTATSGSGGYGMIGSEATILAGANTSGSAQTVTMQWRTRTQADAGPGLISDVVSLGGMTLGGGSQTSPFVLQMSYNPAMLYDGPGEATEAAEGLIYLAWLDPGDGQWENAVQGNVGSSQLPVVGCQLGPWPGNDMTVGDWGVNTSNHAVWAVLDHNSQFAVVPEPGTLALLVAAAVVVVVSCRLSVVSCRKGPERGRKSGEG
ncbi:MAG: autotransporter-associated beta strand repeat-containing protein [Thermoguttaceae bacterium]